MIPKTLASNSLALFFSGLLFSGLINSEMISERGFSCQQVIHRVESKRKKGSDRDTHRDCRSSVPGRLSRSQAPLKKIPSFGFDFKHTGLIFSYQE